MKKMQETLEGLVNCMGSQRAHIKGAELFHFPLVTLKEHEEFEKNIRDTQKKSYLVIRIFS